MEREYTDGERGQAWRDLYERFGELPVPEHQVWKLQADINRASSPPEAAGRGDGWEMLKKLRADVQYWAQNPRPDEWILKEWVRVLDGILAPSGEQSQPFVIERKHSISLSGLPLPSDSGRSSEVKDEAEVKPFWKSGRGVRIGPARRRE